MGRAAGRPSFGFVGTGPGRGAWAGVPGLERTPPCGSVRRASAPLRPWFVLGAAEAQALPRRVPPCGARGRPAREQVCDSGTVAVPSQEVLQNLYRTKSFLFVGCGETLRDQIFQALFLYSLPNKVDLEHYMVVLKESEDHFFKHQADMLLHGIKVVSYGDCFDYFPGYVQDLAVQICKQRSPGTGFLFPLAVYKPIAFFQCFPVSPRPPRIRYIPQNKIEILCYIPLNSPVFQLFPKDVSEYFANGWSG